MCISLTPGEGHSAHRSFDFSYLGYMGNVQVLWLCRFGIFYYTCYLTTKLASYLCLLLKSRHSLIRKSSPEHYLYYLCYFCHFPSERGKLYVVMMEKRYLGNRFHLRRCLRKWTVQTCWGCGRGPNLLSSMGQNENTHNKPL